MKKIYSRRRALAIAAAAGVGSMYAPVLFAQTFDTTATVNNAVQIEAGGPFAQTQPRISGEALGAGGRTFAGYAALDFSANSFAGGAIVSNIDKFVVNLWDNGRNVTPFGASRPDTFATAGPIDFYLSTLTGSTASWRPDTNSTSFTINASTTAGVDLIGNGGNPATGSAPVLSQLYFLGTLNYVPQAASSTSVGSFSLDFSSTLGNTVGGIAEAQFIANQINSGSASALRLIIAPQYSGSGTALTGTAADFVGTVPGFGVDASAPQLELHGTATPAPTNSAVINLVQSGSNTKTITLPTINRMWRYGSATSAVTLDVSGGTSSARYTTTGDVTQFNFSGSTPAPSGTSAATFTMIGGGHSVGPGTTNYKVTGTLHNLDNPGDSTDITIEQSANVLVDTRTVGMVAGNNTFTNGSGFLTVNLNGSAPGVLAGSTVSTTINIGTTNPSNVNPGSNSLTLVKLFGTQTAALNSATSGTATVSAGAGDVTFGSVDGLELSSRTFTLKAGSRGGSYVDANKNISFFSIGLQNADEALAVNPSNLTTFSSDGIDYAANVYQAASVTAASSNPSPLVAQITLTNAAPTSNVSGGQEIGLRAAAVVTSVSSPTAQAGFTLNTGIAPGTTLTAGTPASGTNAAVLSAGTAAASATFDPTGKLNGVYSGKVAYGLQHADQTIVGTAPNDLGSKTANFSATVSGNSGDGIANILPGGSFAGYYINRGSGLNSTVSFLGGTSTGNTNIGVAFGTSASSRVASDRAALTGTGADKYVAQFSYDPSTVGANPNSVALAWHNGTQYVSASLGNSNLGANPVEVNGAFDNNLTLGRFGIDTTNHVVWAVVDHSGTFAAYRRAVGDVKFDGQVDNNDIRQIALRGAFNDGLSTHTWSDGDNNGDGKVDNTDIRNIALAGTFNAGPYDVGAPAAPAASHTPTLTGSSSTPSTTLGVIGDGKPDYVYDPATGDVTLNLDGVQNVVDLHLLSAGGKFIAANSTFTSFPTKTPGELESTLFGSTFAQGYDLGHILPANLTPTTLLQDLTLLYSVNGGGSEQAASLVTTPEPTSLALIGIGAAGLLARRRRSRAKR